MEWQDISTAPKDDYDKFLVFDGVAVWVAWRMDGEVSGYEVDGDELPDDNFPPTHWMPLPPPPVKP